MPQPDLGRHHHLAAPGTYNLTITGGLPYSTPALSGQHRFFFNIINGTLANTLTFTATNGGATTATLVATPGFSLILNC